MELATEVIQPASPNRYSGAIEERFSVGEDEIRRRMTGIQFLFSFPLNVERTPRVTTPLFLSYSVRCLRIHPNTFES